jgi:hypothetical protein
VETRRCLSLILLGIIAVLAFMHPVPATAQTIKVTSTSPNAVPQGTVNLNVTITGSGFVKGAQAQWFVSGTTNPGGVTVNSTAFNGSTQLTANITVADNATIGDYDVIVATVTRTGKGTDASTITAKGTPIGCTTTGTPAGATLVTMLNPVQSNGAALITSLRLGDAIRVRPLDLNGDDAIDTLVAFVTSGAGNGSIPGTYIFLLDPATGEMQTTNPVTGAAWQNPILLLSGVRATQAVAGDVNGDHIPDFAFAGVTPTPYLFVGSVSSATSASPFTPSWTAYPINPPAGAPTSWGASVAMGDVDGLGADEVVVGATSAGSKNKAIPGAFIFKYTSGILSYVREIQDPTGTQGSLFGAAVAVGNIDGKGNDLVVGAPSGSTNGLVYVFPHPVQQSTYFTLTGPGPNFGRGLGIGDVNLDTFPDLVVITGLIDPSNAQALLYFGTVHPGSTATQLLSAPGLGSGWGDPNMDVTDMTAAGVVAVGAPNAGSCGAGVVHLFTSPFGSSQYPSLVFETPSLVGSAQFGFGYGVGIAPGYPFIVIGEHFRDVGTTTTAGQVYVYKLN